MLVARPMSFGGPGCRIGSAPGARREGKRTMSMEMVAWQLDVPRCARHRRETAVLDGHAAAHRWRSPGRTAVGSARSCCSAWSARCWRSPRPVLAGRVIDAIVNGGPVGVVVGLAVLIAVIAVAEAGLGIVHAVAVGVARRGADPRPARRRVRPRAAPAGRLLHPHPHRRAGQPAQQRRHRRAAGVQRHPLRGRRQPRHARAHARRDAQPVVAGHAARAGAAAGVRAAGPADGPPAGRDWSARPPTTTRPWAPR